jgi:acyl-CoA reductase-like NAD-dependent aldehyde dehydrogenase
MKIINPATQAIIADVSEDGATSILAKYARARAAQPAWAALPIKKRLDAVVAFRARITAMHETLARTLTLEVGKPIRQSRNELNGLLGRIDFFLAEAPRILRDQRVHADAKQ